MVVLPTLIHIFIQQSPIRIPCDLIFTKWQTDFKLLWNYKWPKTAEGNKGNKFEAYTFQFQNLQLRNAHQLSFYKIYAYNYLFYKLYMHVILIIWLYRQVLFSHRIKIGWHVCYYIRILYSSIWLNEIITLDWHILPFVCGAKIPLLKQCILCTSYCCVTPCPHS